MTSKVSDGENTSPRKEKPFDGNPSGNRYARSYKSKVMDRSGEKKYSRSKSRTNRPDDAAQNLCPVASPIKVRDRSWLMGDSSNSEESSKSVLPVKGKIIDSQKDEVMTGSPPSKIRDKNKVSDLTRDEVNVISIKGKEKGKLATDNFNEETGGSSPSKFREKARATDDNLFLVHSPKGREKNKPTNEPAKGEYSLVSGNSPIKLREKIKTVDISKDEMNSGVSKSQEKSKFGVDDGASSSIKMREKLKVYDASKEGAIGPAHKDAEKGKGNISKEDTSVTRTSPIKLREKNRVSDEFSGGFVPLSKKVKSCSDFIKETPAHSACKSPINSPVKSREKGRMEKHEDSLTQALVSVKMREKGRILSESVDNDTLIIGMSNKSRERGKLSDELKNGGDFVLGKKEVGERGPPQGDSGSHDHEGIPLSGKREGKIGYSGKTRKLRAINAPLHTNISDKKLNPEPKLVPSRYDEKPEVSTSEKLKTDISILNDQNASSVMIDEDEVMNSNVSSSQDQKVLNKPITLKVIQNRSQSRINDDGEWHPGDLAWGRVGQHPFWPCMVTVDVESGEFKKSQKLGRAPAFQILHVHFFGDKGRHSWLPSKNILKYEGRDKLQRLSEEILAQIKKKDKKFVSSFIVKQSCKSRWEGAVEEADKAVSLSRDLRKNFFENLLLNKTDVNKVDNIKLPKADDEISQLEMKENKRRSTVSYEKVAKKLKSNIPSEPEKDICNRIPRHMKRGRSRN